MVIRFELKHHIFRFLPKKQKIDIEQIMNM